MSNNLLRIAALAIISLFLLSMTANAATSIPFTITTSEAVNVTGTPRIAVDVGGVTRYATYTSGTGTSSLTFTYTMVAGIGTRCFYYILYPYRRSDSKTKC